jgi:hypothetical protein
MRIAGRAFVAVGAVSSVGSGATFADFINGNFATGERTGWTASAIDQTGNPVTQLISVASSAGKNFVVFNTGPYASGPFDSTVSQPFVVRAAQPILSFDFGPVRVLFRQHRKRGRTWCQHFGPVVSDAGSLLIK